ncbi:unnamed protein product [Amoebophrya sp. A25]|nr:unnamed protein product [Amoebophrya sp. A25]|eukprot:GSA25T00017391001.1
MANSVNDTSKPPFFAYCCYTRSGVFLCLLPQQRRRSWSVYQFYRFWDTRTSCMAYCCSFLWVIGMQRISPRIARSPMRWKQLLWKARKRGEGIPPMA